VELVIMTCRVLVCDDEPAAARDWLAEIEQVLPAGAYDVQPVPSSDDIKHAIQALLHRRMVLIKPGPRPEQRCLFDEADVLVIDYDLVHVDEDNTRYTGEEVARLARAFSECGVVVLLNQFVEAQFDLGLRGHMESFADLNIDGALLGNEGLWREGPWTDFRPWHWPVLDRAAQQFRKRVAFLSDAPNFSIPILQMLRMTQGDAEHLSDTAFGFLAPTAETYDQIAKWTFAEFLRDNSAAVDTKDTNASFKNDPAAPARFVASRVAKWLEREVLGPQHVLVDVPHLIQRCPFLLRGDISHVEVWNRAVHGGRDVLHGTVPASAWFSADEWLSRPAVWWQQLEAHEPFQEARAAFDYGSAPNFVFLEDASRFGLLGEAREFRAGFHNPYDRRYLKFFDEIRYAPQRRLAFGA
jgi:hypothetical protein